MMESPTDGGCLLCLSRGESSCPQEPGKNWHQERVGCPGVLGEGADEEEGKNRLESCQSLPEWECQRSVEERVEQIPGEAPGGVGYGSASLPDPATAAPQGSGCALRPQTHQGNPQRSSLPSVRVHWLGEARVCSLQKPAGDPERLREQGFNPFALANPLAVNSCAVVSGLPFAGMETL